MSASLLILLFSSTLKEKKILRNPITTKRISLRWRWWQWQLRKNIMRPLLWCLLAMWPTKVSEGRAYIYLLILIQRSVIFFLISCIWISIWLRTNTDKVLAYWKRHWNFVWFLFLTQHILYLQNVVKTEPLIKWDCTSLCVLSVCARRSHPCYFSFALSLELWFCDKVSSPNPLYVCMSSPMNLSPVAGNHFEQNDTFFERRSTFSAECWGEGLTDVSTCLGLTSVKTH